MRSIAPEHRPIRLRYLQTFDNWHSWYPLLGLDRAMADAGLVAIADPQGKNGRRLARLVSKVRLMRNFRRSPHGPVFVAMMGFSEGRTLPFSYWNELVPYAFDCWPNVYGRWTGFFRRHRVRLAFFSARQSAEYFRRELPAMTSIWLPEGVDPAEYRPSQRLADRAIDVLELGRKHDGYHAALVAALADQGKVHRYERVPREKIFPTRQALTEGLATSRISICFPRSMTHPEDTIGVETVTHRYFESIASGCILVGHCPDELSDLFGYNPVVEVDWGGASGQIARILADIDSYQEQVDANYRRLLEVGTWRHRVAAIIEQVEASGLSASPSDPASVHDPAGTLRR